MKINNDVTVSKSANLNRQWVSCTQNLMLILIVLTGFNIEFTSVAHAEPIPFSDNSTQIDTNNWYISDGWANGDHQSCEWRSSSIQLVEGVLKLSIDKNGGKVRDIGCAEIRSKNKTSYGLYEARIRTAAGSGLNTAFFTFIGPPTGVPEHDEIDFEFLGKDPTTVSVTHYVNGINSKGSVIKLGFDASKQFHNYAIEWLPHKIRWYVDKVKVYETPDGTPICRNPTRIYLSLWSGSKIEDDWMGPFTFKDPVSAEFEWIKFTPVGHN